MKNNNKKPLMFMFLIAVVGIVVGGTLAYYSTTESFENEFNAANYVVEVEETFESPDNWSPGTTTPKEVIATNRSDMPISVRIKLTSSWEDANGDPISIYDSNGNKAAIINFTDGYKDKWTYIDGYYYYLEPLDVDETTTSLLESVTFNPDIEGEQTKNCQTSNGITRCFTTFSDYAGGKYTLQVDIETCQYNGYDDLWDVYLSPSNTSWNDTLMYQGSYSSSTFGKSIDRSNFESITTFTSNEVPLDAIDSWDCSAQTRGSVMCWYTDKDNNNKYELYIGQVDGVNANPNSNYAFYNFTNLDLIDLTNLNTSQVTKMSYMFGSLGSSSTNLEIIGLDGFNTSNVTNMSRMFDNTGLHSTNLNIGDISGWDISKVTDMSYMFFSTGYYATTLIINNVNNWDVSNVENMYRMFSQTGRNLPTFDIIDLSNWDTSKVTNMSYMFTHSGSNSTTWSVGDLSGWDTSKVTNMSHMFDSAGINATTWSVGDLSGWDTSKVEYMNSMFSSAGMNATTFNVGNIGNWTTSNVTTMESMFAHAGCYSRTLYIGDLSNWNVSNVTTMYGMFWSAGYWVSTFNIGDLSNWDTSKVTNMSNMFNGAGEGASTWNNIGTLKVYATDIGSMFKNCHAVKATLNIYSNPTTYTTAFQSAATWNGSGITVNYSSSTTNIDSIIATKSSSSNVVKGTQLN